MKFKNLTACILALLLLCGLAGCGGEENTGIGSAAREVRVPMTRFTGADDSVQYRMQLLENFPQGNLPAAEMEPLTLSPEAVTELAQRMVPEAQWTLTPAEDADVQLTAEAENARYTCAFRHSDNGTYPDSLSLEIEAKGSPEPGGFTPEHLDRVRQEALTYLERMDLGQWSIVQDQVLELGDGEQIDAVELVAAPVIDGQPCYLFRPREGWAMDDLDRNHQGPVAKILCARDGSTMALTVESPMQTVTVEKQVQTLPLDDLLAKARTILEGKTAEDYLGRPMEDVQVEIVIDRLQYALVYTEAYGGGQYVPTLVFRGTFDVFDEATATRHTSGSYDEQHFVLLTLDARDGQPLLDDYDWYNYLQMGGDPWADSPDAGEG